MPKVSPSPDKWAAFDPDTTEKTCSACHVPKTLRHFHRAKFNLYGVASECKDCARERVRFVHYRRTYGLTEQDYFDRLMQQGNACKLCGSPASECLWAGKPSFLAVDHDHRTGEVRGLLCHRCNVRVAMVDDPQWASWLDRADAYLGR